MPYGMSFQTIALDFLNFVAVINLYFFLIQIICNVAVYTYIVIYN